MRGRFVDVVGRAGLDDLPAVHDRDAVGEPPHDGQVVGDEDVREAELSLQAVEQVDDLGLDGDVERRDRLVADQDLGPDGERAGDHHALALTAGELVRVAAGEHGVEPDLVQQRPDVAGLPGGSPAAP